MTVSMASSDTPIETLAAHIKNYKGYDQRDTRPQSDKAIRTRLIETIKALIAQPTAEFKAADLQEQTDLHERIERTKRKLNTICSSLSSPTYHDAAFFSTASLPSHVTERIYELEHSMMEEIEHIDMEFSALRQDPSDAETFEDHFLHIKNFIDNINQALFEREALIVGDA
mgnify:FL=1